MKTLLILLSMLTEQSRLRLWSRGMSLTSNIILVTINNIIGNLRFEITKLKTQLTDAKKGGSLKSLDANENISLPSITPGGTPKLDQHGADQNPALQKKQLDLNLHFEKEAIHKKKILECDKENERLAFDLFGKEIQVRKLTKYEEADPNEISTLK